MASGTAPNTSIILTDDELNYINDKFNGKKSAAIHAALETMMNNDKHTITELASDRSLWEEFIDPGNVAPFEDHTQAERESLIRETFPNDFDSDGKPV